MNLETGSWRLVLEGKPLHQPEMQFEGFPRMSFCPKTSTSRRWLELSPFAIIYICFCKKKKEMMPLWNELRDIIVKLFLQVFLSLTISGLKQKKWMIQTQGTTNQSSGNIESHSWESSIIQIWFCVCKIHVSGINFSKKSYAMLLILVVSTFRLCSTC